MASPYDDIFNTSTTTSQEDSFQGENISEDNEIGTFQSIMAGLGSGLFKIPEGLFSLGATLIDLGADTNKAAEVEAFFAKINPLDEMAAATTAGKITELITNMAIPGGIAFKLGNTAVKAARGGKYLNMSGNSGKNINKGIQKTVNKKNKIKAFNESASSMEKAAAFAAGAGAGGVAEGIFIGDVEDAGTFGDLIGGPTKLERELAGDVYDPAKEILNRIKFGTEGALFTGALGGIGAIAKKLKDTKNAGKVADRNLATFLKENLSSSGRLGKEVFETSKRIEGTVAADRNMAENAVMELDGLISGLFPFFKRLKGDKVIDAERKKILAKMNKLIVSGQTTPEQLAKMKRLPGEKDAVFAARKKKFFENAQITPTITGTKVLNQAGRNALNNSKRISSQLKFTKDRIAQLNKTPDRTDADYLKAVNFNAKKYDDLLTERRKSKINPKLSEKEFVKEIIENKKPSTKNFLTEEIQAVSLGGMNKKLLKEFTDDIKKLQGKSVLKDSKRGKVLQDDITDMVAHLNLMRMGWNKMFSMVGARLDTNGVRKFEELFGKKVSTWLDRSYNVFKGRNGRLMENYPITAQAMKDAKVSFQKVYQESIKGMKGVKPKLSDAELQQTINNVMSNQNISFDRGFKLANKGDPSFRVPGFFVGKSAADEVLKLNNPTRLSELTGIQKEAMDGLFGKNNDALQTIITATQDLSSFVRNNQLKDDLLIMDKTMKKAGRTGIFADTVTEGIERFSKKGQAIKPDVDFKQVGMGVKRTPRGLEGLDKIKGSRGSVDYDQTLKPIKMSDITGDATYKSAGLDEFQPSVYNKRKGVSEAMPILDPIADKYALTGNVDGIFKPLNNMADSQSLRSKVYQNLILYPKATSQMAKTILSPFTHARNFISAGAFAMANGMIPFADREAVRQAWNALQTPLIGTRKAIKAGTNIKRLKNETDQQFKIRKANYSQGNEFYQKLLRLGVVNSQVQLGDLQNLLGDVKFGGITGKVAESLDSYGLNKMLKILGKAKKVSEDLYTAEDDFWKIFSFIGEGKRLRSSYRAVGVSGAQEFHDLAGAKRIKQLVEDGMSQNQAEKLVPKVRLTEDFLDKEAASIVRNNIPNYSYVSDMVKGLRKWPIGNFVSFPSEIIRTGGNVVERGLDEFFYTTRINGKLVNPLRTVGLRRLTGMAFTTAAVPAGVVAGMSALYDVTDDERKALKNYVAEWSKNSTLVPIRNMETNKLSVIDFSHSNAYDTLSRPIQTILNKLAAGEGDRDGMMDDVFAGLIEATKELGQPFVSESIWTEALSDLWMRGGKTREGFDVWEDKDGLGIKLQKGIIHLMRAQAPLNWKQLQRLGLSVKPTNDIGRIDDRGKQYQLGNEALGVIGFRAQEIDPNESIKYKIAKYNRDARESKSLFTKEVLKGGVTTPKAIVDAYINANRALFQTEKQLYKDINDAKILNADNTKLTQSLVKGVGKRTYGKVSNKVFTPVNISKNVIRGFEEITQKIQETDPNYTNPFYDAMGAIYNIQAQLFNVGLDDEENIPNIENPFDIPLGSELISSARGTLPNVVTNNTGFLNESNVSIPTNNLNFDKLPANEKYKTIFPNG